MYKIQDPAPRSYWLHFSEKTGDTLPHILRLLCAGHVERISEGIGGWKFRDIHEVTRLVFVLFEHMNELHDRLGLPDRTLAFENLGLPGEVAENVFIDPSVGMSEDIR
ncbi:MAG: hypothetical protein WBM40_17195 [Thiohalocapsa sp.]